VRALACALLGVLLTAGQAVAADLFLKSEGDLYCAGSEPAPWVAYGTLTVVSDTEWALCRPPPLCPIAPMRGVTITGTTTWLSAQRGVFIGSSGGTVYEAELVLDRDGRPKRVRGRSISVAPDFDGACSARAQFRNVRRMK
jgi:hypothetical protein